MENKGESEMENKYKSPDVFFSLNYFSNDDEEQPRQEYENTIFHVY